MLMPEEEAEVVVSIGREASGDSLWTFGKIGRRVSEEVATVVPLTIMTGIGAAGLVSVRWEFAEDIIRGVGLTFGGSLRPLLFLIGGRVGNPLSGPAFTSGGGRLSSSYMASNPGQGSSPSAMASSSGTGPSVMAVVV